MKGEDEGEGAQGKPAKEAGQGSQPRKPAKEAGQGSRKRNQPRKPTKEAGQEKSGKR